MSTEMIAYAVVVAVLIPLWRTAARINAVADDLAAIKRMLGERYTDPDEDYDPDDHLP